MPRPKPPAWLKQLLVPAWNGAHHAGWAAREVGGALLRGRIETCDVCGRRRPMVERRRVVPAKLAAMWGLSDRQAAALARKESLDCLGCGAKLRARRLARAILTTCPVGDPLRPAPSIAAWAQDEGTRSLRVAEINRVDGLHDLIACLPGHSYSEYLPGAEPGTTRDGARSEDLTRLTYPDASFDLVVTSETLEHVPDLSAALREIRRVLRPGGWHVFTVPRLAGVPQTYPRARLAPDGSIEPHVGPLLHHPGGDVGYPVFTEFGADLAEILAGSGFDPVRELFGPATDDDVGQVWVCGRPRGVGPQGQG